MTNQLGSQPLFTISIVTCETVQERLIYLRGILHRKWKEIQSDEFSAIPCGTLYKIMHTGKVPKKWWRILRIKAIRQPRIAISKVNMHKAANTIVRNITPENVVKLTQNLIMHVLEQKQL